MLRISELTKAVLIFLLVCCTFTSSTFAQDEQISTNQICSEPIKLNEIIRGKSFFEKLSNSSFNEEFRVFIKADSKQSYDLLSRVGKQVNRFHSYSGILVSISKANLYNLIFNRRITGVWEDSDFYTTADSYNSLLEINSTQEIANFTSMVLADALWNDEYYGTNTKVAILDTGIMTDHPALNVTMNIESRIFNGWNFIDNNDNVEDDNGHGTSVAGIIGANGLYGYSQGVAPNCSFLIGKVLDYNGVGTTELLIQGIDWAVNQGADVINLSLGAIVADKDSPEIEAISNAVGNGTLVCVAAGNMRGKEEFGYNDLYTILSPGIARQAITVGAIDNNKILYEHSSAGPVAINYDSSNGKTIFDSVDLTGTWLKPDVVAPGVKINTTAFDGQKTHVVSGTSYSTAVVSGVCLLLKERYPETKPSTVKASLLSSSMDISPEIVSSLGDIVATSVSSKYQGAGLVNSTGASQYLELPPALTIWPNKVPFTHDVYLLNELSSFYFSIYVNTHSNSLTLNYHDTLKPYMSFYNLPRFPNIGQYDVLMELETTEGITGFHNFPIGIFSGFLTYNLDVSMYVTRGKGRILFDCNEVGANNYYSMFGNLNSLLDLSRRFGYLPSILSKDGPPISIFDSNISNFEIVSLINFNNSNLVDYSLIDRESILNYTLGSEGNGGKTLIVLPTRECDIIDLNSFLEPFNISYNHLLSENETLDVSSISHELLSIYNYVDFLAVPSPLEVIKENDSSSTIIDRFVFYDSRLTNGSLIVAGNNVEMFQNSPYLYNGHSSNYEEELSSIYFADNYHLYENIMEYSAIYEPTITYTISTTELTMNEQLLVTMNAKNNYGSLKGWDFFLTFETPPEIDYKIRVRSFDVTDNNNGTYTILFSPGNLPLSGGNYLLSIRSPYETKTWEIYLVAEYSYGPLLVIIPIAICVLFFAYQRLRKTRVVRR